MTRKDRLIAMNGQTLIKVADGLGVKVSCNRTRTALKEAKINVIERILAAENQTEEKEAPQEPEIKKIKTQEDFLNAASNVLDGKIFKEKPIKPIKPIKKPSGAPQKPSNDKPNKNTVKDSKEPKKPNLRLTELTYKGKTKSIKAWAEEIGMPWPTLYDRVNRNNWPIDEAFETPLGQRRKKA